MVLKNARGLTRLTLSALVAPMIVLASSSAAAAPGPSSSLLEAWLEFVPASDIVPPYAFIRADHSAERLKGAHEDLIAEFDRLRWRLEAGGYAQYVDALDAWRVAIGQRDRSRVPGDWSPSYLLSHPNSRPPVARVVAIGACDVPQTVGVWSSAGYRQIAWRSDFRLSDLYEQMPAVRDGTTGFVSVVTPTGQVNRYGTQAWNYADGVLSPGAQVVGSFPLSGEVFGWMQDAMADYLAHTPSGVNCREQDLSGERVSARAKE
tara:strand:+ start:596 stop:1381 length:786 start_codon:yes stop_codon:yes gene_type:complete